MDNVAMVVSDMYYIIDLTLSGVGSHDYYTVILKVKSSPSISVTLKRTDYNDSSTNWWR